MVQGTGRGGVGVGGTGGSEGGGGVKNGSSSRVNVYLSPKIVFVRTVSVAVQTVNGNRYQTLAKIITR